MHRAAIDATRVRLLDATRELLAEFGQSEVRIASIVERAGVARGTFYLHFSDVSAILRAVALEFLAGLDEKVHALPDERSAIDLIRKVMRTYLDYILDRRAVARAAFALIDVDPDVAGAFSNLLGTWAARTERALERWGGVASPAENIRDRCFMLLCMMEGFVRRALGKTDSDATRLIADRSAVVGEFSAIWFQSMFARPTPT